MVSKKAFFTLGLVGILSSNIFAENLIEINDAIHSLDHAKVEQLLDAGKFSIAELDILIDKADKQRGPARFFKDPQLPIIGAALMGACGSFICPITALIEFYYAKDNPACYCFACSADGQKTMAGILAAIARCVAASSAYVLMNAWKADTYRKISGIVWRLRKAKQRLTAKGANALHPQGA